MVDRGENMFVDINIKGYGFDELYNFFDGLINLNAINNK
tara:strand:- start:14 stop:130 length:117 start_codon:yes stop_codon:yes gene_type:complete